MENERLVVGTLLALICAITAFDVIEDLGEGVALSHVAIELSLFLVALLGTLFLLRSYFKNILKLKLKNEELSEARDDASKWKNKSKVFIEGLIQSIDEQFEDWGFSESEKEVARLLIKGLSNKEISEVRGTSEKTIKAQITSIFKKSNLKNRSELMAFFLEDLFVGETR